MKPAIILAPGALQLRTSSSSVIHIQTPLTYHSLKMKKEND